MDKITTRTGAFTASDIYRLIHNGTAQLDIERDGAKGVGYTAWIGNNKYIDTIFGTVAEYDAFVRSERKRLSAGTLSDGAKTHAERKAMELLFGDDDLEPQIDTADIRRGNQREAEACLSFEVAFGCDLHLTGDAQLYLSHGDWGATPDGRIGSPDGVTMDVKSPKRQVHLSNLLTITGNDTLLSSYPVYYWQQQCQIAASENDHGYWCSYNPTAHNPGARLHIVRIDRNQDDIGRMLAKVELAAEYRNEIVNRVRSIV